MIGIREAQKEDLDSIAIMEKEIFSDPYSKEVLDSGLENEFETIAVALDESGNVLGYVIFQDVAHEGELLRIAVKNEARKNGVGEMLLHYMVEELHSKNTDVIFLEVRASNEPALNMYEKNEFQIMGTRKGYYKNPVEDAVIMKRG
ncbi:MAG: ribosomal protein S18-alanine N-acetyltransferase [Lachnospiraceae bacterium]|nr:ribosomal protein S18-alanine N-acetyltransferase [Lachnospiraceae bacterium]